MDDLIRRQDAIRAVTTRDGCGRCEKVIKSIPSAQKKGHWKGERLKYPSGLITFIYRCSECGYEERHAYEDTKPSNYCPTCGAYMRGDTDEIIY